MNKQRPFRIIVIGLLLLFLVNNSTSQTCCGIGGSLVSGGHPVLNKKTLLASSSGTYADAKDPEDRRRGSVGVLLAYGITDRLSFSLKTSYIWARYSYYQGPIDIPGNPIPGKTVVRRNNGFGDGFAAVQYAIIKMTPMNKQEFVAGIDAGIPWGPDSVKVDGVLLPGNVQTGTGEFSINGFVTYLKAFPVSHYSLTATVAGRVKLNKEKKQGNGNEFSVLLTSLFGPLYKTRGSITFDYFLYGKNVYDIEKRVTDSKTGMRLSLIPALEYSISPDLKLSISAEMPLVRNDVEKTYGNDKVVKADIYWFIPFVKNNSRQIKTISF
jgi:hypothetical protein